eukprot:6203668-Pleurochrysis_carterae.AAC.3
MLECCPHVAYQQEYKAARSHFHAFLNICLNWHMHEGSRLSGYLVQPITVDRRDARLRIERMPVRPAKSCHYFDENVALVPLVEKVAIPEGSN